MKLHKKNIYHYVFPLWKVFIAEEDGKITNLFFSIPKNLYDFNIKETESLKCAAGQLRGYFDKKLQKFDLELSPDVSNAAKAVLRRLTEIPYGKTKSYRDIAMEINKPSYARAVGMICGKNPIPIFIPCHRVICSDGSLGGFLAGIKLKRYLLNMEKEKNA